MLSSMGTTRPYAHRTFTMTVAPAKTGRGFVLHEGSRNEARRSRRRGHRARTAKRVGLSELTCQSIITRRVDSTM